MFGEIIDVYCENHVKHTNSLQQKNAHMFNVK
jgi:hypothetical protein